MDPIQSDMLEGVSRLALVGVAKNCGKTTTLNYLLASEACAGRTTGLVSIGIDGESADLLIGTKKPPIQVRAGHWVVTARDALARSSARIEYVEALGFSTPLGEVVVGRVIEEGTMVLAGLRHRGDLEDAAGVLESHGVDLVLIDGAYGRTVAARPEISDGVIVSTGAVLSSDVDEICARTVSLVGRLALEPAEAGWQRDLLSTAIEEDRCLLGGPSTSPVELSSSSALLGLRGAAGLFSEQVAGVAIPGLVSDSVVEELVGVAARDADEPRTLLVPDGTVLQASSRLLTRLERSWKIRALESVDVVAVSINPTGVRGDRVDAERLRERLLEELCERWPKIAVFDPCAGRAG